MQYSIIREEETGETSGTTSAKKDPCCKGRHNGNQVQALASAQSAKKRWPVGVNGKGSVTFADENIKMRIGCIQPIGRGRETALIGKKLIGRTLKKVNRTTRAHKNGETINVERGEKKNSRVYKGPWEAGES